MIHVLFLVVGQCHPCLVQSHADAVQQVIAQQVYTPVYAVWRVGEDEYQTQMIEKLAAIAEQNQQIIQTLRQSSTAPAGPAESAVTAAAKAVLNASCVKCHNATNKKGDVDLTGTLDQQTKLLVEEVSRSGAMPPKSEGKELSDEDFAKISAWAHEDAKAVRAALRVKKETPKK